MSLFTLIISNIPIVALAVENDNLNLGYSMMGDWPQRSSFGYGGMIFGGFFMIVFWLFFIGAIIWLVKALSGGVNNSSQKLQAMNVLKERYAKGEISKKEFDQIKKDINQ